MITKAQELAILDDAIQAFGPHSYLGPWLASVRAEVERDLRSDFVPAMLPSEALTTARAILATAEQQAAAVLDTASTRAEQIRAVGAQDAQRERLRAVTALQAGLMALGAR